MNRLYLLGVDYPSLAIPSHVVEIRGLPTGCGSNSVASQGGDRPTPTVMECAMCWKIVLTAGFTLSLLVPEAWGQAVNPLPGSEAPPVGEPQPGNLPSEGNAPADPGVLYPTIRPTEVSAPTASAPATPSDCNVGCENFWTRPTLTGDWWGGRPRSQERGITFEGNLTQFGFGLGGGLTGCRPVCTYLLDLGIPPPTPAAGITPSPSTWRSLVARYRRGRCSFAPNSGSDNTVT